MCSFCKSFYHHRCASITANYKRNSKRWKCIRCVNQIADELNMNNTHLSSFSNKKFRILVSLNSYFKKNFIEIIFQNMKIKYFFQLFPLLFRVFLKFFRFPRFSKKFFRVIVVFLPFPVLFRPGKFRFRVLVTSFSLSFF